MTPEREPRRRPAHPGDGEQPEPRVVVRDRRRIDPDSGAVREPAPGPAPAGPGGPGAPGGPAGQAAPAAPAAGGAPAPGAAPAPGGADAAKVAELTDTLQRLKAEYDNYRRRAERERAAAREQATGSVLLTLLPVLDDLDRARAHGDLVGAFGVVGESLISLMAKLGLERFAEPGEHFDPQVHEAVMQAEPSAEATEPVVAEVFRTGYRHAGRVLRPAQVSVSEPAHPAPAGEPAPDPAEPAATGPEAAAGGSSHDGQEQA